MFYRHENGVSHAVLILLHLTACHSLVLPIYNLYLQWISQPNIIVQMNSIFLRLSGLLRQS